MQRVAQFKLDSIIPLTQGLPRALVTVPQTTHSNEVLLILVDTGASVLTLMHCILNGVRNKSLLLLLVVYKSVQALHQCLKHISVTELIFSKGYQDCLFYHPANSLFYSRFQNFIFSITSPFDLCVYLSRSRSSYFGFREIVYLAAALLYKGIF